MWHVQQIWLEIHCDVLKLKCAWAFVTFINLCTCTRLPFWGKVGAVQTMWLNLWIRDQVVQCTATWKEINCNLQQLYLCSDRDAIFVGLQYLVWATCMCTFWGKAGEVFTMWINLLMQNQVVQPHDKKSNQNNPTDSRFILILFLVMWLYNLVLY